MINATKGNFFQTNSHFHTISCLPFPFPFPFPRIQFLLFIPVDPGDSWKFLHHAHLYYSVLLGPLWWTWGVAWGEAPKAAKKTSAVLHVPSVSPLKQTWNCTLCGHVCYTSLKLGHFRKLLGKLGLWECRLKLLSFLCTHRNASMRHFRFQASCENFYSYIFTLHLRQVRRL